MSKFYVENYGLNAHNKTVYRYLIDKCKELDLNLQLDLIPDDVETFKDYVFVPVEVEIEYFYYPRACMWGRLNIEPNFIFITMISTEIVIIDNYVLNDPDGEFVILPSDEYIKLYDWLVDYKSKMTTTFEKLYKLRTL